MKPETETSTSPREGTTSVPGHYGMKVIRSCTIRQPADVLYAFWRNLPNLTRIIKHPVGITERSPTESRWSVSAPGGDRQVEWDATIINDTPGRLVAWRSLDGGDIDNAGSVRFEPAPGDEGTEVTVKFEYNPPGGRIGALLGKLSADDPEKQVAEALRRFKALMEAGEIPTTDGQPVGEPQRSNAS